MEILHKSFQSFLLILVFCPESFYFFNFFIQVSLLSEFLFEKVCNFFDCNLSWLVGDSFFLFIDISENFQNFVSAFFCLQLRFTSCSPNFVYIFKFNFTVSIKACFFLIFEDNNFVEVPSSSFYEKFGMDGFFWDIFNRKSLNFLYLYRGSNNLECDFSRFETPLLLFRFFYFFNLFCMENELIFYPWLVPNVLGEWSDPMGGKIEVFEQVIIFLRHPCLLMIQGFRNCVKDHLFIVCPIRKLFKDSEKFLIPFLKEFGIFFLNFLPFMNDFLMKCIVGINILFNILVDVKQLC